MALFRTKEFFLRSTFLLLQSGEVAAYSIRNILSFSQTSGLRRRKIYKFACRRKLCRKYRFVCKKWALREGETEKLAGASRLFRLLRAGQRDRHACNTANIKIESKFSLCISLKLGAYKWANNFGASCGNYNFDSVAVHLERPTRVMLDGVHTGKLYFAYVLIIAITVISP